MALISRDTLTRRRDTGALEYGNRRQGHRPVLLAGEKTWDPASVANSASTTTTVTVAGAAVGDPAVASHAGAVLGAGVTLSAEVTAANTVTVTLSNASGGAVDRASAKLKVRVLP